MSYIKGFQERVRLKVSRNGHVDDKCDMTRIRHSRLLDRIFFFFLKGEFKIESHHMKWPAALSWSILERFGAWFHLGYQGLPKSKSRLTQKMLGPGKKKPLTSCWKDRLNQPITNTSMVSRVEAPHVVSIFASGVSSHVTSSKDLTFPAPAGGPQGPKPMLPAYTTYTRCRCQGGNLPRGGHHFNIS